MRFVKDDQVESREINHARIQVVGHNLRGRNDNPGASPHVSSVLRLNLSSEDLRFEADEMLSQELGVLFHKRFGGSHEQHCPLLGPQRLCYHKQRNDGLSHAGGQNY